MEKKMKISSVLRKRIAITSLLFVGIMAGNQFVAVAADGPQTSSISSMSIKEGACWNAGYTANIAGSFPEVVTGVVINGVNLASTDWTQTTSNIAVQIPASSAQTFTVQVVNGQTPLLATQSFECVGSFIVVTGPTTETEDGGLLPDTGSNNYNYLVAGIGLALFGSISLLRRKLIQE
jgi:LPXTG-motif cell wall-anchored protein